MSSLEQRLGELTEIMKAVLGATEQNNALLQATLETRKEALEKLEATAAGTERKPRTPRAKVEAATGSESAAAATPPVTDAPTPTGVAEVPAAATEVSHGDLEADAKDFQAAKAATEISEAEIRAAFGAWLNTFDTDDKKKAANAALIAPICQKFQSKNLVLLDQAGRRAALFYLARKQAGLEVDFNADYDFAGDPTQDAPGSDDGIG